MALFLSRTYADRSGEKSNIQLRLRGDYADAAAQASGVTAMENALDGISAGLPINRAVNEREKIGSGSAPNVGAQREKKLLVTYSDNVTFDVYNQEVPIVDENAITYVSSNSDEIRLDDGGVGEQLKTAWEANMWSKNGNPITVTKAIYVGRNL